MNKIKIFNTVEVLRFLAAMAVLITHYKHFFFPFFNLSNSNILPSGPVPDGSFLPFFEYLKYFYLKGHYGVYFFWTLSGFVLAFKYINKNSYKTSAKKYFLNRAARLYPLHLLSLLTVLILQTILLVETGSHQITGNSVYTGKIDLSNFFLHLFFISGWAFENTHTLNFPIWSVSIEILIYIIFFYLIKLIYKYKLILSSLLVVFFLLLDKSNLQLFFSSCGRYFFTGVLVYILFERMNKSYYLLAVGLVSLIIALTGTLQLNLLFPSILIIAGYLDLLLVNKMKNIFTFFGNLTYSIYLLHIPVQLLFILIIFEFKIDHSIFSTNYFFIIFNLSVILFSFLSFKYFENPMRKYIRNFS